MPGTTRYSATFDRTYEEEDRVDPSPPPIARRSRSQSWQANSGLDGTRPYTPLGGRPLNQRSSSTDNGPPKGPEHIPTRTVGKTAVKAHNNPFQFVKVGTCPLYRKAEEQLKKAKDVKKPEVLKEEEEWQLNLDSWKSRRRKMSEDVFRRQEEIRQFELEEQTNQVTQKKTKTFSEMVESRQHRGRALSLCLISSPMELQNWEFESSSHKNGSCSSTFSGGSEENSTVNSDDEGVSLKGMLEKSQNDIHNNHRTNGDSHIEKNGSDTHNGDYNKLSDLTTNDLQMKQKEGSYIDSGLESISSHRAGDTPDSGSDFSHDSGSSIDCESPRTGVNILEEFCTKPSQMSPVHEVAVKLRLNEKGQDFGFTFLGGKNEGQVIIASVLEGSKADSSSIHLGDQIITIDGQELSSKKHIEIAGMIQKARERGEVTLLLWRHSKSPENGTANGFSKSESPSINAVKPDKSEVNSSKTESHEYEKSVESENEMFVDDFDELQKQSELLSSSSKSELHAEANGYISPNIKVVPNLTLPEPSSSSKSVSNGFIEKSVKNAQKVNSEIDNESETKSDVNTKSKTRRKGVYSLNVSVDAIKNSKERTINSLFPLSPVTELPSPDDAKTMAATLSSNLTSSHDFLKESVPKQALKEDAKSPLIKENNKSPVTANATVNSKNIPLDNLKIVYPQNEAKTDSAVLPPSPSISKNAELNTTPEIPQDVKPKLVLKKVKPKIKKVITPENTPVVNEVSTSSVPISPTTIPSKNIVKDSKFIQQNGQKDEKITENKVIDASKATVNMPTTTTAETSSSQVASPSELKSNSKDEKKSDSVVTSSAVILNGENKISVESSETTKPNIIRKKVKRIKKAPSTEKAVPTLTQVSKEASTSSISNSPPDVSKTLATKPPKEAKCVLSNEDKKVTVTNECKNQNSSDSKISTALNEVVTSKNKMPISTAVTTPKDIAVEIKKEEPAKLATFVSNGPESKSSTPFSQNEKTKPNIIKKTISKPKNANSQKVNTPAKQTEEFKNVESLNIVYQSEPKNVNSEKLNNIKNSDINCGNTKTSIDLVPDIPPVEKVAEEMEKLILEQLEEEERAKEQASGLQIKTTVSSPEHLLIAPPKLAEPPKEKPPPPPCVQEVTQKDSSLKRVNSTKRIKKEICKRRSNFLGIDSAEGSLECSEPSIPPPPALDEILKAEMELDRQSRLQVENASTARLTLEEKEIMQREKEIIESLESEERQKMLLNGIQEFSDVSSSTTNDVAEEERIQYLKEERKRLETERLMSEEQQLQLIEEKQLREREEFIRKQEADKSPVSLSAPSFSVAANVPNTLQPSLPSLSANTQSSVSVSGTLGDGKSLTSNSTPENSSSEPGGMEKVPQKPAVPPKPLKKKEAIRKERERLRQEQEALVREREEHRRKLLLEQEELLKHQKSHALGAPVSRLGPLPPLVQPSFQTPLTSPPSRDSASFPSRSCHGAQNGAAGSPNTAELMAPVVARQSRIPPPRKAVLQSDAWGQQKENGKSSSEHVSSPNDAIPNQMSSSEQNISNISTKEQVKGELKAISAIDSAEKEKVVEKVNGNNSAKSQENENSIAKSVPPPDDVTPNKKCETPPSEPNITYDAVKKQGKTESKADAEIDSIMKPRSVKVKKIVKKKENENNCTKSVPLPNDVASNKTSETTPLLNALITNGASKEQAETELKVNTEVDSVKKTSSVKVVKKKVNGINPVKSQDSENNIAKSVPLPNDVTLSNTSETAPPSKPDISYDAEKEQANTEPKANVEIDSVKTTSSVKVKKVVKKKVNGINSANATPYKKSETLPSKPDITYDAVKEQANVEIDSVKTTSSVKVKKVVKKKVNGNPVKSQDNENNTAKSVPLLNDATPIKTCETITPSKPDITYDAVKEQPKTESKASAEIDCVKKMKPVKVKKVVKKENGNNSAKSLESGSNSAKSLESGNNSAKSVESGNNSAKSLGSGNNIAKSVSLPNIVTPNRTSKMASSLESIIIDTAVTEQAKIEPKVNNETDSAKKKSGGKVKRVVKKKETGTNSSKSQETGNNSAKSLESGNNIAKSDPLPNDVTPNTASETSSLEPNITNDANKELSKTEAKAYTEIDSSKKKSGGKVKRVVKKKTPSVRKQNQDSLTESRYNQNHWLIQEAEMRRIAELKERQRSSSQTHLAEDDVCSNSPRVPVIPPTHNQHLNFAAQDKMWNYSQTGVPTKKYPPPVVKEQLHTIYPRENASQQPPMKPSRVVPMERKEQMLSVSGRKRCSHCNEELGRGAAMIIESLQLYYHIHCFQCCVCQAQLGNGSCGADVRVRNQKLHCNNCYSNDEAGLKFSQV